MKKLSFSLSVVTALVLSLQGCGVFNEKNKGKGFNLFTVQQDKELGQKVAGEIASNPQEFPILPQRQYQDVYNFVFNIRNKILNTGKVDFKDEFDWEIKIIRNDTTLNAFCTPGGYIYIYTGLLKFLDSEDQLAGVMGHEMGHADMRHSTRQMTKMYGVQILLDVLAGDREALKQVSSALIGLKFSRKHETEADERSVHYLCPTHYNAAGGAGFFKKMQEQGSANPPEFLSTHPDPGDRIESYYNAKTTMGCQGEMKFEAEYRAMINKLP